MAKSIKNPATWPGKMQAITKWFNSMLTDNDTTFSNNKFATTRNQENITDTNKNDTLVIGPVQCMNCSTCWNVLAYARTVTYLECPNCGVQHSRPKP